MHLATCLNKAHALLFTGPQHSIKKQEALKLAKALIETDQACHPDLFEYFPEGKLAMHSMEAMRSFKDEVYRTPYSAKKKVFILHDADRMPMTCANALLKTLEEPLTTSVIILISTYPDKLLPTIRSRCQVTAFLADKAQAKPHPLLVHMLSHLDQLSVAELLTEAQNLAKAFDEPLERLVDSELSALQQEAELKQHEGKEALALSIGLNALFEHILAWFRDVHLLSHKGNPEYLYHQEHQSLLQQGVKKGHILDLDELFGIIRDAKNTLERSTPLRSALETLFLRLYRILT
jgi:DNA polymerase-3 subunit delta'